MDQAALKSHPAAQSELDAAAIARDYAGVRKTGYFNVAAIGLVARPVLEGYEEFSRELAENGSATFFNNVDAILHGPRMAGARLFGADPENVAAATSVSEVISQVAWWLRPQSGQNVVSLDIEPGAVTLPWLRVAEETGAEVRLASVRGDLSSLSIGKIAELVDRNTVAICISHVQWITGHRFDLKELADLAHAHGALLIVDAMQSCGVVPIDVKESDVDIMVTGSYKWMGSFGGVAACYIRPELTSRFRPIMVGSRSTDPLPPYDDIDPTVLVFPEDARRLEYASTAHPSRVAFSLAVDHLLGIGVPSIFAHTQALCLALGEGLLRLGARLITPLGDDQRAGIMSAELPGYRATDLAGKLAMRGVTVSPRLGLLRFACHLYNDADDVAFALEELGRILGRP